MEKLLELDDIMLIPGDINSGCKRDEYNFSVLDNVDRSISLPIFTSPMPSVVGVKNWRVWNDNGIKPIIPRTTPLELRLEACEYIFSAFSIKEVIENFLRARRSFRNPLRISIDCGNGHDSEIFKVGSELKRLYPGQVITMAGNIGSPKVYINYTRAKFDYVRLGISSGSLVDMDMYGFHYPTASFLIDLMGQINTMSGGNKETKIIVDGGIERPSDILKCLALGADYVMIGREFVKLIEADGEIYKKKRDLTSGNIYEPVENPEQLLKASPEALKGLEIFRHYSGNTTPDIRSIQDGYDDVHDWMKKKPQKYSDSRSDWVQITKNLRVWLDELYDVFTYGFTMAGAKNWAEFRKNVKPIRIK